MSYIESKAVCNECNKRIYDDDCVVCEICWEELHNQVVNMEEEIISLQERIQELERKD